MSNAEMNFHNNLFVAVHAGAGYHSSDKASDYKKMCKEACLQAMRVLEKKGSASEAVAAAVTVLEDAELSNAGRGSSLTIDGTVECDAAIMDGATTLFGAVGCVRGVQNPVKVARHLLVAQQTSALSHGRIPPSVLVGEGARQWARQQGFSCDNFSTLITEKSRRMYIKYKRRVDRSDAETSEKKTASSVHSNSLPAPCSSHSRQKQKSENDCEGDGVSESCLFEDENCCSSSGFHKDKRNISGVANESNINKECDDELNAMDSSEQLTIQDPRISEHFVDSCRQKSTEYEGHAHKVVVSLHRKETTSETKELMNGKQRSKMRHCAIASHYDEDKSEMQETKAEALAHDIEEAGEIPVQDTVGALCIDWQGHVSAGVSSGGIWLKQPGRLGPAAMFGAACWAQNGGDGQAGVAVITSGCGEHLMRTVLAKTCADCLVTAGDASEGLNTCFSKHFIGSRLLPEVKDRLGGAVAVVVTPAANGLQDVDLCWGHSTESMAVGYMRGDSTMPKTLISRLSESSKAGQSFAMSGAFFSQETTSS